METPQIVFCSENINVIIKNMDTSLIEYLECPICYDFMSGQIMICVKGHSICHECYRRMNEEGRFLCPTCHNGILGNRNITLEKVSSKIKALMEVNNNAVLCKFLII
ncbi:hypothetical protein ABEB36_007289 [Hypothenemus hampei]|uniref:RING-type domain-containing protein n=1 Tax=Hypothenemus hampei TaxID=57062 RepID=A0ABD1EVS3_HYPHA